MFIVGLKTSSDRFPWFRQTPQGDGVWENYQFTFDCEDVDFLVVYDDVLVEFKTRVPKSRRVLVIGEPRGMKRYTQRFIDQFGLILCPYELPEFDGDVRVGQVGLPWFYGIAFGPEGICFYLDFETLVELPINLPKENKVSVICSTKTKLPGHKKRLRFIHALKNELGDDLVVFGRGFNPISDKAEVISKYKYHLVLENNQAGHHWTEKLADTYLGGAYPLFAGPIATLDDFPNGSLIPIDIDDAGAGVEAVKAALSSGVYEEAIGSIQAARDKILFEHNFFPMIVCHLKGLMPEVNLSEKKENFTISPSSSLVAALLKRFKKSLSRIEKRNQK